HLRAQTQIEEETSNAPETAEHEHHDSGYKDHTIVHVHHRSISFLEGYRAAVISCLSTCDRSRSCTVDVQCRAGEKSSAPPPPASMQAARMAARLPVAPRPSTHRLAQHRSHRRSLPDPRRDPSARS